MLYSTKRPIWPATVTLCTLGLVWYLWSATPGCTLSSAEKDIGDYESFTPDWNSSNSTLGFSVIYVLSADPESYRLQGLLQAASFSGIQVQPFVPERLTDEELFEQVKQEPKWGWGHARAALGHLSILKSLAQSEFETALILEDDADFSINIRAHMETVSQAIWNRSDETWTADQARHHPYREDEWNIFWLGHTGLDYTEATEVFEYDDPNALPWKKAFSTWNGYYEQIAAGGWGSPRPRLIYKAAPHFGSFAYATTRAHAASMVKTLSAEDSALRGEAETFDIILGRDCRGSVVCVAPAPELFHHQQVEGEKSINEAGDRGMQDLAWYRQRHKFTYNINWSARCNVAKTGESIGDRWQCLPNKGDSMDS